MVKDLAMSEIEKAVKLAIEMIDSKEFVDPETGDIDMIEIKGELKYALSQLESLKALKEASES